MKINTLSPKTLTSKISLATGFVITITVVSIIIYDAVSSRITAYKTAGKDMVVTMKLFEANMNRVFTKAEEISMGVKRVAEFAQETNPPRFTRDEMVDFLKEAVLKNRFVLNFSVIWDPNAYDGKDKDFANKTYHDGSGRFIPAVSKKSPTEVEVNYVKAVYMPEVQTMLESLKKAPKNILLDPFKAPRVDRLIVPIIVPILKKGAMIGSVNNVFDLGFLQAIADTAKLKLYEGKAEIQIVSSDGTVVVDTKNKDYVQHKMDSISPGYKKFMRSIEKEEFHIDITNDTMHVYLPTNFSLAEKKWVIKESVPIHIILEKANFSMWIQLSIGMVMLIICIYLSRLMIDRQVKSLKDVTESIIKVSNGNLSVEINLKRDDEIGQLADSFSKMIDKLRHVVDRVQLSAKQVATGSNEISSNAAQIAQGANEQAAISEEVSSSMEEMTSTISQNADNARLAETIATELNKNMTAISIAVDDTNQATKNILQKISVINEIAQRTDMLAINAAIEAARAGTYGKGFATVAIEVRKLAEKTIAAAKQIDEVSKTSFAKAEISRNILNQIIPEISRTVRIVQEISAASLEQSSGTNEVNNAIQDLSNVIQQNSASAEEMASASEEFASQASSLLELISFFKLTDENNDQEEQDLLKQMDEINEKLQKLHQTKKVKSQSLSSMKTAKEASPSPTSIKLNLNEDDNFTKIF